MPLKDLPFYKLSQFDIPRPCLPVTIKNSSSNTSVKVYGLIDTGADECALPADFASLLGFALEEGEVKDITTGNGITRAYSHKVDLEVKGLEIKNVIFDFMPNLHVPLLGTRSFLSHFVLTIDYHRQKFSLLQWQG